MDEEKGDRTLLLIKGLQQRPKDSKDLKAWLEQQLISIPESDGSTAAMTEDFDYLHYSDEGKTSTLAIAALSSLKDSTNKEDCKFLYDEVQKRLRGRKEKPKKPKKSRSKQQRPQQLPQHHK